jgi:hypothetical protein
MKSAAHTHEVRPRNDRRGFDLISDQLPFGAAVVFPTTAQQSRTARWDRTIVQLSLCPLLRQAESDTHIGKALNETFTLQCLQCASSAVSPSRDVLQRLQIPNFDV